jgi:hypothetical protein
MKVMTGWTPSEMAKILKRKVKTVRQQIYNLGIKPLTKEATYPDDTLEALRNIQPQGRPKKAEAVKPKTKGKKGT